ncbi:hypothetical protein EDC04DRAFT_2041599 [Pisolithus marmoratus]|nr:hypothetical protein EDC04DRAFT_2041599 [Pisolithus marmoratus]
MRSYLSLLFFLSGFPLVLRPMQNKTSTLPFPDYAPPSTATAPSQTLAPRCHLGYMHYDAAPGYGIGTIDGRELPCLISSTGEDVSVSISEVCKLSPLPVRVS